LRIAKAAAAWKGSSYRPWIIPGRTPAFAEDFYRMTWRQVDAFVSEMIRRIPERLGELERYVRSTDGFSGWRANYSVRSLAALGPWLHKVLRIRRLTARERRPKVIGKLPKGITVSDIPFGPGWCDFAIVDKCRSVLVDTGLYVGEALRQRYSDSLWCRSTADSRDSEFHQPILAFGASSKGGYPPFSSPDVVASRIIGGQESADGFAKQFAVLLEAFNPATRRDHGARA